MQSVSHDTHSPHDDLARRAQDGDHDALHQLLELIDGDGSVRTSIRRLIVNTHAVEDISHDVLVVVVEKLHTWDRRRRFTTWLHAIARNKAIDHLRSTQPTTPLPDHLGSDQRRISSLITTREAVRAAVRDLPEAYRICVHLRDIEQLDYDEISRALDLPPSTVRTRVSRGRALLAATWSTAEENSPGPVG